LAHIPSDLLQDFAEHCLASSFTDGGLALQDIVNQVGRRLGFPVEDGRYRGVVGEVGFDGIWRAGEGVAILVEVKTTDAFRLSLDTTARYRRALIKQESIPEESSSILYVVGRSDTGDLEAQVRGSPHAWDIRIIGIRALFRVLKIKEELEDQNIVDRIRAILRPQEFTRVDGISVVISQFLIFIALWQQIVDLNHRQRVGPPILRVYVRSPSANLGPG
jgi:hypothetical protein